MRWLILLLFPVFANGQSARDYLRHTAHNWPTIGLSLLGGYADGTADALQHHYGTSVFRRAKNQQWYDPSISWQNKYKDWPTDTRAAFPGAKTALVWTTDAWHMAKTIRNKSMQGAVVLGAYRLTKDTRRAWWWPIADFAITSFTFSVGWHLADITLTN